MFDMEVKSPHGTDSYFHGSRRLDTRELPGALEVKSVDVESRRIRVLASNDSLDRHGEKILPSAFTENLRLYQANPVILASHTHRLSEGSSPVVGRAVKVWIDKKGLWAVIELAKTTLGEQYWTLYRDGFQKAVSVGFIPLEWKDETGIDGGRIRVYTKVTLLEISCVAVPSNPEALVKSKREQFVDSKRQEREAMSLAKALGLEGKTLEQLGADAEDYAEATLLGDEFEIKQKNYPESESLGLAEVVGSREADKGLGIADLVKRRS